jgi:hypothetical protein
MSHAEQTNKRVQKLNLLFDYIGKRQYLRQVAHVRAEFTLPPRVDLCEAAPIHRGE